MSAALLLQDALVAAAVLASAAFVLVRQFPVALRRARVILALALLREGRGRWLQRAGRWVAPAASLAAPGCGGCNSCETGAAPH